MTITIVRTKGTNILQRFIMDGVDCSFFSFDRSPKYMTSHSFHYVVLRVVLCVVLRVVFSSVHRIAVVGVDLRYLKHIVPLDTIT